MLLNDEIFDTDAADKADGRKVERPNQNPTNVVVGAENEELTKQRDYQRDQSNNKDSNDASAARYMGANGYTQRSDQKDQLDNLHIGGDDLTPQGANNHATKGEQAQGPGFTQEGSYELDEQGEGMRMHEQKLGEAAPGESVKRVQDEAR